MKDKCRRCEKVKKPYSWLYELPEGKNSMILTPEDLETKKQGFLCHTCHDVVNEIN